MCRNCRNIKIISVGGGFTNIQLPRTCDSPTTPGEKKECSLDPYIIIHEKCSFIDQQVLKFQEAPNMVPVGELPRHILLNVDRYLTNKVTPGSRCTVIGIYSIYQNKSFKTSGAVAIRNPYVRVVGLQVEMPGNSEKTVIFTEKEEDEFLKLSRNPNLYEIFASSIGSSIYGNTGNILVFFF